MGARLCHAREGWTKGRMYIPGERGETDGEEVQAGEGHNVHGQLPFV